MEVEIQPARRIRTFYVHGHFGGRCSGFQGALGEFDPPTERGGGDCEGGGGQAQRFKEFFGNFDWLKFSVDLTKIVNFTNAVGIISYDPHTRRLRLEKLF